MGGCLGLQCRDHSILLLSGFFIYELRACSGPSQLLGAAGSRMEQTQSPPALSLSRLVAGILTTESDSHGRERRAAWCTVAEIHGVLCRGGSIWVRTRGLNSQRTAGKSTWPRDQNVQSHGTESGDKDAGQGEVRGQKWLLQAESSLGDAAWPTGGFKCFKSLVCVLSRFSRVRLFATFFYGLQSTRLLCPWDSPGKNTRGGCHALLQGIFPTQGEETVTPVAGKFFTAEPPGSP